MQWLEITINTKSDRIDALCSNLENIGVEGVIIDDEAEYSEFLKNNKQYWDYVDEKFANSIKGVSRVKFYLEDSESGKSELERIKGAMPEESFSVSQVQDEDWENNWKEFYKPLEVGKELLIVPEWEDTPEQNGRRILRLDPGLIFGTGAHPTTQMCLKAVEEQGCSGKTVLDLGCGSGILSIAALVLGAKSAVGCDIDPKAPDIAMENASLNGITEENYTVYAGDILSDTKLKRKIEENRYDILFANIVADVIIALAPKIKDWIKEDGIFICSGIIDGRQDEVKEILLGSGLDILCSYNEDNWHCFKACLKRQEAK